MERYVIFKGNSYYPSGGMNDFEADFSVLDDALKYLEDVIVADYIREKELGFSTGTFTEYRETYYYGEWAHVFDLGRK